MRRMAPPPSTDRDPTVADATLVDALVQLTFAVQQVLTEAAAEHDLSLTQLRLGGILRDRTVTMSDLARHLHLDKSSVTGLVTRAERRGLVRRLPSPDDGRGVLVEATPQGRALGERIAVGVRRRVLELAAPLSAADRTRLTALVERALAGSAGVSGERASGGLGAPDRADDGPSATTGRRRR
jgi:DNA-binding MarR family transcriptional regulator